MDGRQEVACRRHVTRKGKVQNAQLLPQGAKVGVGQMYVCGRDAGCLAENTSGARREFWLSCKRRLVWERQRTKCLKIGF